ncbi:AAA domain-containing protein [Heracleum sosnowskyi]|uniref:AAA domain-containing protein n=1 Tax=Heracleum sosnowskyi TaxID=360622 RepID=A0AAD8MUG8_9APIA|nr:AAA domain-containing protein [Heracleum sosnowskyi]
MENPADAVTDLRSPPPSRARRRLVQSTLVPHTPLHDTCTTAQDCHKDEDENKMSPKATPRSPVSSEVVVTKEDTPSKEIDKEEDSHPPANDLKSPQKRKRLSTATPEKRRTSATPKKRGASATPEKLRKNSTPKKKLLVSGLNDGSSGKMINPTRGEHASQSVPDLRLEAKLQAEENSRLYGGKQIHPFFSSRKTVKRTQERTDEESNSSSVDKKGKSFTFSPIHVFEQVKDDDLSLDWGNWIFLERSDSTNFDLENKSLANYERKVKALHFDNFLNVSGCWNDGSSYRCPTEVDKVPSHHSPFQQDYLHSASSMLLTDEQVADHERSIESKENHNMSKVDPYTVDAGSGQNSNVNCGDIISEEKMMSYGLNCVNQLENSLWTTKYQPKKANEICGNGESVNSLNDWLRLWNEKGSGTNKIVGNICSEQDADHTCGSDSEDMDEENRLKNVLLITGPVGSGKSAAIYACAKEQGFQVIEVNASDWRNGALVKQRFGEAVESHWLQCAIADQGSSNEVIEIIPLSDGENFDSTRMTHGELVSTRSKSSSEQNDKKTLILFEDVDAVLEEDRGFIGTIQQLAETAKRPMILTSNSNNPVLPNNLDRMELCFSKPSLEELLCLVSMVCSAENVTIPPCLVKRFIESCHGDIRKTILHLQFWCQGQTFIRDRKILGTYGLMVFDTDAGHNILPKTISCDYPSQLSEIVHNAITKSILEVEEASHLNGTDEEELNMPDSGALKFRPNSIDARKEAMLSWHCSDQDRNEFPFQLGTACELSNSSGSPLAFSRRVISRRTETVLSSESGEECSRGGCPFVPAKVSEEEHLEEHLELITNGPSLSFAPDMSNNTSTEQLIRVTKDFAPLDGTCRSVDVSCVPESSYVPETEFCFDTLSWGNVSNMAETAYIKNDLSLNGINLNMAPSGLHEIPTSTKTRSDAITNSGIEVEEILDSRINCSETALTNYEFPVRGIDLNVSPSGSYEILNLMQNNSDTNTVSEPSQEVADSHVECVRAVPVEYHGMDECSSKNFGMRSKYKKYHSSFEASDTVRETWRRLRHSHGNLQQYAILEQEDASKVLNLAHGLCNLISEANMLLSDCQLLICDYLEPSMVLCEESHSLSWHDDHLKMVSTMSEHGMCLYAKDIDAACTDMFSAGRVDLTWEMLASSTSTMALGKLVNWDSRRIQNLEMGPPKGGIPSQRQSASSLCCVVRSLVPKRSYLSIKGNALHEYLSSLSQISRSEDNRLSESFSKSTKRRVCVARNYLSNAAPSLTPEDISLLSQYCNYQKVAASNKWHAEISEERLARGRFFADIVLLYPSSFLNAEHHINCCYECAAKEIIRSPFDLAAGVGPLPLWALDFKACTGIESSPIQLWALDIKVCTGIESPPSFPLLA